MPQIAVTSKQSSMSLWCRARNLDPGSQKAFGGMMRQKFTHDPNNGYPRYVGVRAKVAQRPRLAVNNA